MDRLHACSFPRLTSLNFPRSLLAELKNFHFSVRSCAHSMVPKKGKCRDPVLLLAQERAERQEFLRDFGSSRHAKRAGKGKSGVQPASSSIGGDAQNSKIALAAGHNSQDGDCEAATKGKRGRLGGTISRRIICSDSNVDVTKMSKHRMVQVVQELAGNRDGLPEAAVPNLQCQQNFTFDSDVVGNSKEERPISLQGLKDSEATIAAKPVERSEESPKGTSSHDVCTPPFGGKSNCDNEAELDTEVFSGGKDMLPSSLEEAKSRSTNGGLLGHGYRDTFVELRKDLQQLAADSLGKGLEELKELGSNAVPMFLSKLEPTSLADCPKTSPQERRKVKKVAKSTAALEPSHTSIVKPRTRSDNAITPSLMLRSGSERAAADKRESRLPGLASELDLPILPRPSQGITVAFWEGGRDDSPGLRDYQTVGVDYRAVFPLSSDFGALAQLSYGVGGTLLSDQSLCGDEQPTSVLPRPELGFPCPGQKNLLWDLNLPAQARSCPPPGEASDGFLSPVGRLSFEGPEPTLPFDDMVPFGREIAPYGCEARYRLEVEDNSADDLPIARSHQQLENGLVHAAAWGEVLSPAVDSLRGRAGDMWQPVVPASVLSPPEERRIYARTQFLPLEDKRSTEDLFGRYDEFM